MVLVAVNSGVEIAHIQEKWSTFMVLEKWDDGILNQASQLPFAHREVFSFLFCVAIKFAYGGCGERGGVAGQASHPAEESQRDHRRNGRRPRILAWLSEILCQETGTVVSVRLFCSGFFSQTEKL